MKSNAMHTRNMINTTSKQARGFTLIDMLVSLAIMTLLIATLLPALAEARRASKRAVCMTHEYDMGKHLERYAQDHKGYFPHFQYSFAYDAQSLSVSTQMRSFTESGMDYMQDINSVCPEVLHANQISYLDGQNQVKTKAMDFGMNVDLLVRESRMFDLVDASRTVTMYDG